MRSAERDVGVSVRRRIGYVRAGRVAPSTFGSTVARVVLPVVLAAAGFGAVAAGPSGRSISAALPGGATVGVLPRVTPPTGAVDGAGSLYLHDGAPVVLADSVMPLRLHVERPVVDRYGLDPVIAAARAWTVAAPL